MNAKEVMDQVRESAREKESKGHSLSDCAIVLTESQHEALEKELVKVSRIYEGENNLTEIQGMPVFVVPDVTHKSPPFVWTGRQPPSFAERR